MAEQNTQQNSTNSANPRQTSSLYVGDLAQDVSEANLYDVFSGVGPVASIRVCRDSSTRRSLGYAYVNFHNSADAERCLETLNFSNIKGKPCRIMWSFRDPSVRKTATESNIFVKNIDKNVDTKTLHDAFSIYGNILSCKIRTDPRGRSLGFGFVHFETEESAKDAIENLNNSTLGDKQIYVGKFQKKSDRDAQLKAEGVGGEKAFTNVYAKHFPDDWDETKLKEEFEKHGGPVSSIYLTRDLKNRPFCFCNFENTDDAKNAVDALNGLDLRSDEEKEAAAELRSKRREDRLAAATTDEEKEAAEKSLQETEDVEDFLSKLYVSRAQTKTERSAELKEKFNSKTSGKATEQRFQGVNLYIKNLDDNLSDEGLKDLFKEFGTILSVKVMRDDKGNSRGFGFVSFTTPDEATKAVTEMHLKLIDGKPLYVGLHERKEARQERLQNRYRGGDGMMGQFGRSGFGAPPPAMYYNPGMAMRGGMNPAWNPQAAGRPGMPPPQRMPPTGYPGASMNPQQAAMIQQQQQARMQQAQAARQAQMQAQAAGRPGAFPPPRGYPPAGAPQPGMMPPRPGFPGAPQQAPPAENPANQPLTAAALAAAPQHMQKQMLGEKLFPLISRIQPEYAGKITGMMLEMDNSEMLMLLESETQLRQKVQEAMRVLEHH